jgi:hypothetical protein
MVFSTNTVRRRPESREQQRVELGFHEASSETRRWLDRHRARLPSCPCILVTFPLPQELRPVARSDQRVVYDALVRAAAETLLRIAADPQQLGARLAILAVLHTWTQDLRYHPHVHVVTPRTWTRDWVVHLQEAGSGQQVLE